MTTSSDGMPGLPPPEPGGAPLERADLPAAVWNVASFVELRTQVGQEAASRILRRFHTDLSGRFADPIDRAKMRRDAHAIASTAGMLGFQELSARAQAAEAACRDQPDPASSLKDVIVAKRYALAALVGSGLMLPQA